MREPPRSVSFISRISGLFIRHPPLVPPLERLQFSRPEIHNPILCTNFVVFRGIFSRAFISPTRLSRNRFPYARIEAGSPFGFQKGGRWAREKVHRSVVLTPLTSSFVLHVFLRFFSSVSLLLSSPGLFLASAMSALLVLPCAYSRLVGPRAWP